MTIQSVKKSEDYATQLISKNKIDFKSSWSFTADDGNDLLGSNLDNWKLYGLFHLGKDTDKKKETKAYYKYPYGKDGKVYTSALRAIRSRSAQQDHVSIFNAAGRLLDLAKEKEERSMKTIEYRNFNPASDIRAVGDKDEWTFEGYAVTWNTIDDYNSTFRKGSFRKTITERGSRIKVLWNHDTDEPIGKVVEIREDKKGLFVKGILTEGVSKASDVYKNLRAGVIDTLSFGFIPLQKKTTKEGILEITEVKLFEVSPVTFEANETAVITDVRSDDMEKKEVRAEEFSETLNNEVLMSMGYKLMESLNETLWDIWYGNDNKDEIIAKSDEAISEFHAEYLKWASDFMENFWEERKTAMAINGLSKSFYVEMTDTIDEISSRTSFTEDELKDLSSGKILNMESRKKLVELPESIRSAHQVERGKVVEALCCELRTGGFSNAEKKRFSSLMGIIDEKVENSDAVLNLIKELRKNVKE